MKKWEYTTISESDCLQDSFLESLRELGEQGWRLVPGMFTEPHGDFKSKYYKEHGLRKNGKTGRKFMIMEREIPDPPAPPRELISEGDLDDMHER